MGYFTINKLGKWLISFLILSVVVTLITNWVLVRNVTHLNISWDDNERSITQKQAYLSALRGSIGYGGMIHFFKNYLLRKDKKYLLSTHKSMLETKILISGYRVLGITEEEDIALSNIERVLQEYTAAIARSERLVKAGYSVFGIDKLVVVDDGLAVNSLLVLNEVLATLRQQKTNVVSDEINSLATNISLAAVLIGGLFALLILVLTWFLRYRLIFPLAKITKAIGKIDPRKPGHTRLPDIGHEEDELRLVATAVNQFLDSMEDHLTQRQKAEIALEKSKIDAEKANQAKTEFLSMMSHEIRTPLNGVLGLAQLLKDTHLDKSQTHKVDTILASGLTLLGIINDVLDMSKIEAGALELEEQAFLLGDLIATITTPFQSLADDKGLKLIVNSGVPIGHITKGDPVRLRQVLWNLLSNAIKFTEKGSVVVKVQIDDGACKDQLLETKDQMIFFSVSDSGTGIAPDRVDHIFDAFTQEDSTITRKHGGTGLGLSIVKQLVELMGGTINAKSQLEEGSTFSVYLPFSNPTIEEIERISLRREDISIQKTEPLNILLAEDNDVNTLIAKAFLKKFGHEVRHVVNGALAFEVAKEGWADLILMDVHMPEMNGIDATKEIRGTDDGKLIPIVGLTAEAFADRHAMFREAGMNDILTKPFTEQQLFDTISINRLAERRHVNRDAGLITEEDTQAN